MKASLRGVVYDFVYRRIKDRGRCDDPRSTDPFIRIHKDLKGEEALEVEIHEMLHACFWDLDEDAIHDTAKDIARVLWNLGYQKEG